ncbi:hypothetical protein AN1653.2 [Paecilomyces variotii No. 5]|uniref:Diphthine--ammonia ligase n=1 Tax=Byssochlamys spectabilis (strain No. 5 / NBRC 109023) TaxID=1356009 RepID=V5G895_BYSSN|nr:hypothetical protein AN1653.2 [Paecilomyces variotii No. 5]
MAPACAPTSTSTSSAGLNVIALISGGKDSLYSILHCIKHGHRVVALANLHPPLPPATSQDEAGAEEQEDMDSFMYQTIGHGVIPLYETALGIPLYRAAITGGAVDTSRIYRNDNDGGASQDADGQTQAQAQAVEDFADETESLIPLLRRIKEAHPEANAVSAGAILSTYQRTRIENVAGRLGLVPLAWLWMYPILPPSEESRDPDGPSSAVAEAGLLEDMAACGCDARIIKVASGGLDAGFLWGNVAASSGDVRRRVVKAMKRFAAESLGGAVLGEGGEYETLAIDGPSFLWKQRISIEEKEDRSGDGGVAYVRIKNAKCLPKETDSDGITPQQVRQPSLFDRNFESLLNGIQSEKYEDVASGSVLTTRIGEPDEIIETKILKGQATWDISNITAPEAGIDAGAQMRGIILKLEEILKSTTSQVTPSQRTTDDIVFATVLLRSMKDFAPMNNIYMQLFKRPNPPARVCVACGDSLPDGVEVMLSVVVDLGPRDFRHGLHVQSRSYWAPANIGPYSQAITIPSAPGTRVESCDGLVYIAGQIPLEPASMEIASGLSGPGENWFENYTLHAVLSLQHLWRIGTATQVDWWLGAIAFLAGEDKIDTKAGIAWDLWEKIHQRDVDEDEDDEPEFDAWDLKYGRQGALGGTKEDLHTLPNFEVVEGSSTTPPFLAVQVAELPRGSDVEWQGLGLRCQQVTISEKVDEGRKSYSSATKDGNIFLTIEIDTLQPEPRLDEHLQHTVRDYCADMDLSQAVIYTAYPLPRGLWLGQIVPYIAECGAMASRKDHEENLAPDSSTLAIPPSEADQLRFFARSPHPYHRKSRTLRGSESPSAEHDGIYDHAATYGRTPRTSSDSGTEADDESTGVLKGLPAPPVRSRKGLRTGANIEEDSRLWFFTSYRDPPERRSRSRSSRVSSSEDQETEAAVEKETTRKTRVEVLRRVSETALLLSVGYITVLRDDSRQLAMTWKRELITHALLIVGLYGLYPLRILVSNWRLRRSRLPSSFSFSIPSSFDPAPYLYPILIPLFVSLSVATHLPVQALLNIILGLSSLPADVVPFHSYGSGFSLAGWMTTVVPIIVSEDPLALGGLPRPLFLRGISSETLFLIFPLHEALIPTLDFLLASSLLPAELQLLATALINLYMFSASPQAQILKALLWLGGLCIFISCRHVLRWEVALARVPTWKFRRPARSSRLRRSIFSALDEKICQKLSQICSNKTNAPDDDSEDDQFVKKPLRRHESLSERHNGYAGSEEPASAVDNHSIDDIFQARFLTGPKRRHTISTPEDTTHTSTRRVRTTPGGRRKRSIAPGLASFLSLTAAQAQVRRWVYALYTYAAVFLIVMGPVRKYVGEKALYGSEPFGWALGYLLGNQPWFRFWTVMTNLEGWIRIPLRLDPDGTEACRQGWLEHLRQDTFGEANTRLLISAYCLLVLITGMAVVLRLSSIVEVDTRRKVFHGMMVAMFLPTVYVDPPFCALALALVLAIFLLLDLFRASQLPPISRPLTHFLAPYVDGRDHRGPVIVSHIFLLIGCAIPLWLSLASLPRGGSPPWEGWEVPSRDVSMVAGVICVGMGDAAASLVGRRFGRHKWFWGGGKSLEGSVAFAAAVSAGLIIARAWIVLGGWDPSSSCSWPRIVGKSILAASGASTTEAVLTGGNDNVIVPVVLWLLVRGLDI